MILNMAIHEELHYAVDPDDIFFPRDIISTGKESEGDHSPLLFEKPVNELAVVHRLDREDFLRRETYLEEPHQRRRSTSSRRHVPHGLNSELFRPLWTAVYNLKKLPKRMVIGTDLERLCIAILNAAKVEERPFLTVGCHVKGLCIILSHKLNFLSEDVALLGKKVLALATPMPGPVRPKQKKTYKDMDEEFEMPKRRRTTGKARKARKQFLAIEDYYDHENVKSSKDRDANDAMHGDETSRPNDLYDADGDYMPMDQIEVLQLMNFGIGLGVGTELAFHSAGKDYKENGISYHNFEHGMVERPTLSLEALQQNRETINPDTFLDIRSLSSPFKLNGYSFTPQTRLSADISEADTTIASTEISLQSDSVELNTPVFKKYDLDWDIYNDPFEEDDDELFPHADRAKSHGGIVPTGKRTRRMVLEYTEPDGNSVHLVKSKGVAKYDKAITSKRTKTPKKLKLPKDQKTLDTYVPSPQIVCDKMQLFTDAIDSLVKSVIGHMPSETREALPAIEGKKQNDSESAETAKKDNVTAKASNAVKGDKWLNKLEKQMEGKQKHQSPRHMFDNETMNTVQVIESYRACIGQQGEKGSVLFSSVVEGRSKENTALIFYRTLVLANAGFIALSQEEAAGSPIEVTPSTRFWEPIKTSRDIRA